MYISVFSSYVNRSLLFVLLVTPSIFPIPSKNKRNPSIVKIIPTIILNAFFPSTFVFMSASNVISFTLIPTMWTYACFITYLIFTFWTLYHCHKITNPFLFIQKVETLLHTFRLLIQDVYGLVSNNL